jgi:voltage-gated potassium channel
MGLFEKLDPKITQYSRWLLLIFAFIFIFITPFFPKDLHRITGSIFYSLIFFTAIFTLDTGRKSLFIVAVIAFITEWIAESFEASLIHYISLLINVIFFQIIVIKLIIQIAKSKKADAGIIFESINGYLMMGLMFVTWIAVAMLFDPNSFSFTTENPTTQDYTYFTFVTMTTLGYGEITPVAPFAKSLSILISTCGQIYVAIIIAMLVGKYAANQNE